MQQASDSTMKRYFRNVLAKGTVAIHVAINHINNYTPFTHRMWKNVLLDLVGSSFHEVDHVGSQFSRS